MRSPVLQAGVCLLLVCCVGVVSSSTTVAKTTTPPDSTSPTEPSTTTTQTTVKSSSTTPTTTTPTTTTTTPTTTTTIPSTTTAAPQLGDPCTTNAQCTVEHAVCTDGSCQCDDAHFTHNNACLTDDLLIPGQPQLNNIDTTSLDLTWTQPLAVAQGVPVNYAVTCQASDGTYGRVEDLTNTSARCTILIPGDLYSVTVTVMHTTYPGKQRSNSAQDNTKPAQPGELQDDSHNYNAPNVTLTWMPSVGVVGSYRVSVEGSPYTSPSNSVQVTGLEAGRQYSVIIMANSGSQSSDVRHGTFTTVTEPPGPPTDVSGTVMGQSGIQLEWSPPSKPNGQLQSYIICRREKVYNDLPLGNLNCLDSVTHTGAMRYQHDVQNLTAGTFYEFEVFSVNELYNSTVGGKSPIIRTDPSVPGKVDAMAIIPGNVSIEVRWDRPSMPHGDITRYMVKLTDTSTDVNCSQYKYLVSSYAITVTPEPDSCDNTIDEALIPATNTSLSVTFDDLIPFTNYTVTVTAYTSAGAGEPETQYTQTKIITPESVSNVTVRHKMQDRCSEVYVEWEIPTKYPGPVTYHVRVEDLIEPGRNVSGCDASGFDARTCLVPDLEEYWPYQFSVRASTVVGFSAWVYSDNFTTCPGGPGRPQAVSYQLYNTTAVCDATRVSIIWRQPALRDRNSNITQYQASHGVRRMTLLNLSTDPYDPKEDTYHADITGLVGDTAYSWQIQAVAASGHTCMGDTAPVNFRTSSCAPPPWDAVKGPLIQESLEVLEKPYETVHVVLQADFFTNAEQGLLVDIGLVISPVNSSVSFGQVEHADWRKASDSSFNMAYRVKISQSPTGELFTIGEDSETDCAGKTFCNGVLPDGFHFYVLAYACTAGNKCTLSRLYGQFSTLKHEDPPEEAPVVAIVMSILAVLVSATVITVALLWYRGTITFDRCLKKDPVVVPPSPIDEIPRKRPIKLSLFEATLTDLHRDSNLKFSMQYEDIQRLAPRHSQDAATEEQNKAKNRWVNILPFDHSRVKLRQLDDDDQTSDYINANYIPGFSNRREYIATQGPLPGTVDDFWRMIWEHNIVMIVMLTQCKEGNRVKCEKYWPDEVHEPKQYGDVVVDPISISPLDKFNITIFNLTMNGQTRRVQHFHYLDFPDFSANTDFNVFIDFVELVRNHTPHDMEAPMVMHCSAGVGRTGTFVAIDHLGKFLKSPMYSEKASVDIFNIVMNMRENRVMMVQTESQYIMIHDSLGLLLERKRRALEEGSDEDEKLYENQAFDAHPEPLYENVTKVNLTEL